MSRYNLPSKNEKFKVVVGYDSPLQTFFAQVIDIEKEKNDDEDYMIFQVGSDPKEPLVRTVEELKNKIEDYASIPLYMEQNLKEDLIDSPPPSPLQKMIAKWFRESK